MELIDLKTQGQRIASDVRLRMERVLAHGQFVLGPEVYAVERALADFVGVPHALGVSDGTTALAIALMALDVGRGDEVITSPFTFVATAEAIALLGATPVFADIDPRTYNIDPHCVERAIGPRTKAIVPVSLFGQCADMDALADVAGEIPVVEDAAQSFGATYGGRRSCGLSTMACTSFFPSKPLGCYGDGGACFTRDAALAERMRQIRVHGQTKRYHHARLGLNGRLDTLQAAVLLAKLEIFEDEVVARGRIAARYDALLRGCVETPYVAPSCTSVYAQYTIEVPSRADVVSTLATAGVPTAIHYPTPLHLQPVFAGLGYGRGSFPNAERASERVLSLPMHPYLTEADQDIVVNALR